MCDRCQPTVAICAQADTLDRRRAIAGHRKHVLPCERELYRSTYHLRGHHCENDVWMGGTFRAECTTDIGRNDTHALGLQSEHPGHCVPDHMRALVRVVEGDTVAAPPRDRRVRFERIVVVCRRGIGMID